MEKAIVLHAQAPGGDSSNDDALHIDSGSHGAQQMQPQQPQQQRRPVRLVLLEIGCGLTVPTVRMEMECVVRAAAAATGTAAAGAA
eukprot:COSAG06_NODE_65385_length_257_cov_0.645570_1_plen_85_part_11